MSELNFTRKIFLEREEISRFQEFLLDDVAHNTVIGNTTDYGIIRTEFTGNDTNFLVSNGTSAGSIQIAKARSQAVNIDGNLIRLEATDNIAVTADSNYYWVRISYQERRYELGTVSVSNNGQLTGIGTTFTDVLRGQATDVPVRIKFENIDGTTPTNNGTYEVVNVVDNTNAILTSVTGFTTETNLRYVVIGTTPIGELVSTEQLTGLYKYDSCLVELIQETTVNTPPALPANGTNRFFYVARVINNGTTVTIEDRRTNYWNFNTPGLDGKLTITQNLSDVADVPTARDSLSVYSRSEVDNIITTQRTQIDTSIATRAAQTDVIRKTEPEPTTANPIFVPTQDQHPANKQYVDNATTTNDTGWITPTAGAVTINDSSARYFNGVAVANGHCDGGAAGQIIFTLPNTFPAPTVNIYAAGNRATGDNDNRDIEIWIQAATREVKIRRISTGQDWTFQIVYIELPA